MQLFVSWSPLGGVRKSQPVEPVLNLALVSVPSLLALASVLLGWHATDNASMRSRSAAVGVLRQR